MSHLRRRRSTTFSRTPHVSPASPQQEPVQDEQLEQEAPAVDTPTLASAAAALPDDIDRADDDAAEAEAETGTFRDGATGQEVRTRLHDGQTRERVHVGTPGRGDALHVGQVRRERTTRTGHRVQSRSQPEGSEEQAEFQLREADTRTVRRVDDVDVLRGTASSEETDATEQTSLEGAVVTNQQARRRRTLNLGSATMGSSRRTRADVAQQQSGVTFRNEEEQGTSWQAGDGVGRTRSSRTRRETRSGGEATSAEETSTTSSTGATYNAEHGYGVRRSGTRTRTVQTGDTTRTTTSSASGTIRRDGAEGRASREGSVRRGRNTLTHRVAADGSFSFDLDPIDSENPAEGYLLTFNVHGGVSGRAGASRGRTASQRTASPDQGEVRAQGSVTGSVGVDVRTVRRIPQEEAEAFQNALETYNNDHSARIDLPEFDRMRQVMSGQGSTAMAAVNDPAAAGRLEEHEEVQFTVQGGAGLSVSAASGSQRNRGGASLAAAAAFTRTVRVQALLDAGRRRVDLRVAFTDTRSLTVGATGTIAGADLGATGRRAEASAESVTVRLDPDADNYDELYRRIIAATTPSQLRLIAESEEVQAHTRARSSMEESSGGYDVQAGAAGATLTVGNARRHRVTRRQTEEGEQETEIVGERTGSMRLGAGGANVVNWSQSDTATGTASASGARVDLRRSESDNDIVQNASDAIDAVRTQDASQTAGQAISRSPLAHIRQLIGRQRTRLSGYNLEAEDVEALVVRSADRPNWGRCVTSYHTLDAWNRLRRTLHRNRTVPSDPDRAMRRNERVVDAICRFVEAHGSNAHADLRNALRRWGANDNRTISDVNDRSEQLGDQYEWPPEINSQSSQFETARGQIRSIDARATRIHREDGAEEAEQMFSDLQDRLNAIRTAVVGCDDFDSPRAKVELLGTIDEQLRDLRAGWARYHAGNNEAPSEDAENTPAAPRAVGGDVERRLAREDVDRRKRQLRANKRIEGRSLTHMQAELNNSWNAISLPWDDLMVEGRGVHDMYIPWYRQVIELRESYRQAGVDERSWRVSSGPGDERETDNYEPNVQRLIRYMDSSLNRIGESRRGWIAPSHGPTMSAWRREWRSY